MIKTIKKLVMLELVLLTASIVAAIVMESYLPPELQEYLNVQYEGFTTVEMVVVMFMFVLFIMHLVSLIGLLRTKVWARKLYISTFVLVIPCYLFIGPVVTDAVTYVLDQAAVLVQGMLLCVLMFNDSYQKSALKKAQKEE